MLNIIYVEFTCKKKKIAVWLQKDLTFNFYAMKYADL